MDDFNYRSLIVWQKSADFVEQVYGLLKRFPPEEKFALCDQIRRAVISVPSNIAEGSGRAGNRDYGHFLAIARGSLYETMAQLEIAKRLGYITDRDLESLEPPAGEVSRMLTSLMKKYLPLSNSNS